MGWAFWGDYTSNVQGFCAVLGGQKQFDVLFSVSHMQGTGLNPYLMPGLKSQKKKLQGPHYAVLAGAVQIVRDLTI